MNDKKQIKEMERVMAVNWLNETVLGTAERLYNAGYRKLPEDSVVIPNKITEETSAEDLIKIAKYNDKIRKQSRKETAEKIFVEVLDLEELKVIRDMGWETVYEALYNEILELAKQFGVEVDK